MQFKTSYSLDPYTSQRLYGEKQTIINVVVNDVEIFAQRSIFFWELDSWGLHFRDHKPVSKDKISYSLFCSYEALQGAIKNEVIDALREMAVTKAIGEKVKEVTISFLNLPWDSISIKLSELDNIKKEIEKWESCKSKALEITKERLPHCDAFVETNGYRPATMYLKIEGQIIMELPFDILDEAQKALNLLFELREEDLLKKLLSEIKERSANEISFLNKEKQSLEGKVNSLQEALRKIFDKEMRGATLDELSSFFRQLQEELEIESCPDCGHFVCDCDEDDNE